MIEYNGCEMNEPTDILLCILFGHQLKYVYTYHFNICIYITFFTSVCPEVSSNGRPMNASLSEDSVAETALSKKNSDGTCRFPQKKRTQFSFN